MTHTPTLVALIAALFFTPTTLASHHGETSDMSLEASKQQMKDKGDKAMSDTMSKHEGKMKEKAANMEKEIRCSDDKAHDKCDEMQKKIDEHKHDKDKAMKEIKSNENMF